jgi:hypothetical protein
MTSRAQQRRAVHTGLSSRREGLFRWAAAGGVALLPTTALAILGGAVFLWRVLAWQPAATVDAWAYAAWGQALVRGERPLFDLGSTTPKPFAALIGGVVAPLPPGRALPVVVALALGLLAAGLFFAANREAGVVAGVAAVVALAAAARLDVAVAFAYIDVVVAALLVAGVALRGRLRAGALVLAGLLRPEAWALAAIAGFSQSAGTLWRRGARGLLVGVAAPALWILGDLALTGDPLGTLHWQTNRHAENTLGNLPWSEVPGEVWAALISEGAVALVILGLLGLGVHYYIARRRGTADSLPIAVVLVWTLLLALETRYGVKLNARYLLPVVAILALGCGFLAGALVPDRLRVPSAWHGIALATGALMLLAYSMNASPGVLREMARNEAIAETRPAAEAVLSCGRLATTPRTARRGIIPQLAASTRESMYEFGVYRPGRRFAGVLHFTNRRTQADPRLPPGRLRVTPLGPLVVTPECQAFQ